MIRQTICPDAESLVGMLDCRLEESQQQQVTGHVNSCETCQSRLESLVTHGLREDVPFRNAAAHLRDAGQDETTTKPEYINRLSAMLFDSNDSMHDSPVETSLDFLEPSTVPNSKGRLGQFEVTDVMGRGGMGIVLKARDTQLDRIVAIKVLSPELASNPVARKRFLREAQAAAAVSHDHVVTTFAVEPAELPYLAMEYIDGQSLQQKLDRQGPLELKEILRIGMQTAQGLAAAHAQGLIHRDIKPSNILLQNGVERVHITDFGLARAVDDVNITRTGEVTGTPQYMSPEQAQGLPIDQRSDLFSLGGLLYAMCTGRSPFRADSTMAVLNRVCNDRPRPIGEVNLEIPVWLVEIIDRLLAKDRDDRFESAAGVADLMSQYLAHVQQPTVVPLPRPSAAARQRGLGTIVRRAKWYVGAIVLLACVGGLGFTETQGFTNVATTVVRLARGEGTLLIEVAEPGVSVAINGEELVVTGAGFETLRLPVGPYELKAHKNGHTLSKELVNITRGGKVLFRVSAESDVRQLTVRHVNIPPGMLSNDGKFVTYVDWSTGDVAIQELTTGQVRQLTQKGNWTDNPYQFALSSKVSPDGTRVAYVWKDESALFHGETGGISLRLVPLSRPDDIVEPRIIHEDKDLAFMSISDWSPDGENVLVRLARRDGNQHIGLISVEDGTLRKLKSLGDRKTGRMDFSPDGHYIAFDLPADEKQRQRDIYVMELSNLREEPIVKHPEDDYLLGWAPSGRHVLFNSDRTGSWDAWAVRIANGQAVGPAELVKPQIGPILPLGFTQAGTYFYVVLSSNSNIYRATIDSETGKFHKPPERIVERSIGRNLAAALSDDGKYLAYLRAATARDGRGGQGTLVIRTEETGHEREFPLKISDLKWLWPRWSPDSRFLLIRGRDVSGVRGVYRMDVQNGDTNRVVQTESFSYPACSLDGKSVFYSSYDDSKENMLILKHDLETGVETVLQRNPLDGSFYRGIVVSPDGASMVLHYSDRLKVMPTFGGPPRELLRIPINEDASGQITGAAWTIDGDHVLFSRNGHLWRIEATGGSAEDLGGGLGESGIAPLSVHPNGKSIVFQTQLGPEAKPQVVAMENFDSALAETP